MATKTKKTVKKSSVNAKKTAVKSKSATAKRSKTTRAVAKKTTAKPKTSARAKSAQKAKKTATKSARSNTKRVTTTAKKSKATAKKTTKSTVAKTSKAVKSPVKKSASANSEDKMIGRLVRLNGFMSFAHLAQLVLLLFIGQETLRRLTVSYLQSDGAGLVAASRDVVDLNLTMLVALFFAASAFAHFFIFGSGREAYKTDIKNGINRARWIEYSVSASIMMALIAILTGIYDVGALLAVFVLTMVMNLMGLVMELWNIGGQKRKKAINWLPFDIGVIAGIAPWVIVGASLWAGEVASATTKIPDFVYGIYFSIFVLFNCFALNMWLQYKQIGPWSNYLFGEKVYIWLSLVAKSALAWQVYFGALQPA